MQNFGTVLTMGEKNVYDGLYVSKSESMDIEKKNTLDQSKNPFGKQFENLD